MINKLEHTFALSHQGAKDFVKSIAWTVICNLSLMLPIVLVMAVIQYFLKVLPAGQNPMESFWLYTVAGIIIVLVLFVLHYFQYAAVYISVFKESTNRRIAFAEKLRKLPLPFFGNRDLSDLTATMITDFASLDQMFINYIPQLFAAVISTTIVGIWMFALSWKMAVAVL